MPVDPPKFIREDWPFPHWSATALLPSWKGHQSRRDLFGRKEVYKASDGNVQISFAPIKGDCPPSKAELAAVSWVIENEASISEALIASLFTKYRIMQDLYGYSGDEKNELMPDIASVDELRSLLRLNQVYVHRKQNEGLPYSGFLFGCTWEPEHALGILMHGSRTMEIGWAETAFNEVRGEDGGSVPGSLIVAPRKVFGWPPDSREDGWIKAAGVPLYSPLEDGFYRTAGAQFSIVGPLISEAEVRSVFTEPFEGRDDLIQFYVRYNGGSRSSYGCFMHCGAADHRVPRNELDKLNIEGFRSIPRIEGARMIPFSNMLLHHSTMERVYEQILEMKAFLNEHIGIAFDHSGRDLCISRKSGRVFFMDWTERQDSPVEVATSFREFVSRFWNTHYGPVH